MVERSFKGIWIPREIWETKVLTVKEKLFLVEIDSLDNENGCFASNSYFADFFGIDESNVSRAIKSLEKKGWITIEYEKKGKQVLKRIIRTCRPPFPQLIQVNGYCDNAIGYCENDNDGYCENATGYCENAKDNNTSNNTLSNNIKTPSAKKNKSDKYDNVHPDLVETLKAFEEMRNKIKAPLTDKAFELTLKKLNQLSGGNIETSIAILEQSIMNSYKGVFELKQQTQSEKGGLPRW